MKKLFLTLIIITAVYISTFGQTKNPVEFGFNIGFNQAYVIHNQSNDIENSRAAINGINLGLSAEYFFSERWGIKAKVIYDQKGWENGVLVVGDNSGIETANFRLNYITIPVMANWHFAPKRNWYLNFGPYAGFLLDAKVAGTNYDVANDPFSSTDFGLAFGLGVKIPLSNKARLFFEIEGQGGVTNINSDNSSQSIQNARSSLNVGINF